MESVKLRTLVLLEVPLLWVFALSVQGHSAPNHDNVIDLLAALNKSHHISGVTRLQSPGSVVYKIRPRAPFLNLPREYSHFLHSNIRGSMGVHLVGQQASASGATLFSLSSASSPILQIVSSTLNHSLHLDYQAKGGARGLARVHFPRRNPFSGEQWVQLAVSLETDRLAFFVDCQEAVVLPIKSEEGINLELPQDAVVTLASTPGKKDSKFSGYLKTAEISMKGYLRRPWLCDNVTDALPPSQYADVHSSDSRNDSRRMFQQDASHSKPQTSHRPTAQTTHYHQGVQSDQLQRGAVLGPPGTPQGVKSVSQVQKDDRLEKLEERLEELARMLDMVKTQNVDLQSRVQYLEGCECVRQRCVWEGREVEDGQRWQIDLNTICACASGKVTCQANIQDPCLSNPCQNGGVCFVLTSDPAGFHCSCPPDTKGAVCQRQLRQVWLPDAVTMQRTLNQADFQAFSLSLQTFSGLFRLWVGGHMASPLAAYDPLYLSHMAFLDKLWAQWQDKHQHGSKRGTSKDDHAQGDILYPAAKRHDKMKPFDVTPDDVISSQWQMCIMYVPITIGAPCNMSVKTRPQGSLKYQKSSFEKRNPHNSSFIIADINSSGFDQHGYDHRGYDRSGWDRWGYGKDGFNRDFIDGDGYAVSGFNRYGFNRSDVTWFGMRKDGVFENGNNKEHHVIDEKEESDNRTRRDEIMSEVFSDKGYSIYGFDPFGLDRSGFDAFGFRTDGYDKDRCNWFFKGPHYLRFYFHTQQQLMSSSEQALNAISRTCPPVTLLPQHWARWDWMTCNPDKSTPLNGQLEQERLRPNQPESDDTVTAATQNQSNVWLPITPDHRFCFKLHWFSGCPLGSAPISCPDLCHQARCHAYPEAVCHVRNCGSCFTEWRDAATGNHVICHGW